MSRKNNESIRELLDTNEKYTIIPIMKEGMSQNSWYAYVKACQQLGLEPTGGRYIRALFAIHLGIPMATFRRGEPRRTASK